MLFGAATIFALALAAAPQPATKATIAAQVKASFQKLDTNKDGKIDKAESGKFHAASVAAREARRQRSVAAAFAKLDTNKDGTISRQEFDALSPRRTASAANAWFAANDVDKNGVVELNEALAKAERNFEALDNDGNGVLSGQEVNAARTRHVPAARK